MNYKLKKNQEVFFAPPNTPQKEENPTKRNSIYLFQQLEKNQVQLVLRGD